LLEEDIVPRRQGIRKSRCICGLNTISIRHCVHRVRSNGGTALKSGRLCVTPNPPVHSARLAASCVIPVMRISVRQRFSKSGDAVTDAIFHSRGKRSSQASSIHVRASDSLRRERDNSTFQGCLSLSHDNDIRITHNFGALRITGPRKYVSRIRAISHSRPHAARVKRKPQCAARGRRFAPRRRRSQRGYLGTE